MFRLFPSSCINPLATVAVSKFEQNIANPNSPFTFISAQVSLPEVLATAEHHESGQLFPIRPYSAVVLMQISAYGTHKNLAVRKIREAMHTAYAKRRSQSQTTQGKRSRNACEYCKRKVLIICEQHSSISLTCVIVAKVLLKRTIHFAPSLSKFLYANFSSTCVGCTHLLKI